MRQIPDTIRQHPGRIALWRKAGTIQLFLPVFSALVLVTGAIVVAGCTDPAPPTPPVITPQISSATTVTTPSPAATTARLPAALVAVTTTEKPVTVFTGPYHWAEYRENDTVTLPPNPRFQWEYDLRIERSTGNYLGSPALHYRITRISDYPEWVGVTLTQIKDGWVEVEDTYYDSSTNRFLGETRTETIKGVPNPATGSSAYSADHCREEQPCGEMGIEPFGEMNITLTDRGKESVTVPAGTYPDARKYTGTFRDGTPITFWVVSGVPVPVQYQFPNKYIEGESPFQSYELRGWG